MTKDMKYVYIYVDAACRLNNFDVSNSRRWMKLRQN
jgi:hypothetical protein